MVGLFLAVAFSIVSPSRNVDVVFDLVDSVPSFDLRLGDKSVGQFRIGPEEEVEGYELKDTKLRDIRESWMGPWGGERHTADCREMTIRLQQKNGRFPFVIEARAYDAGFAVRYRAYRSGYSLGDIHEELFGMSFEPETRTWAIPQTEATYTVEPVAVSLLAVTSLWRMPFTFIGTSGVYGSMLEADVRNWPRSYLRADGRGGVTSRFVAGTKYGHGELVSPWRVVLLSPTPAGLVMGADLVQSLNAGPRDDFTWVRPGFAVSNEQNCRLETEDLLRSAKIAALIGARYLQVDWGWYGTETPWTDADTARFVSAKKMDAASEADFRETVKADPTHVARGFVPYMPALECPVFHRDVRLDIPRLVSGLKGLDMGLSLYVNERVLDGRDLDKIFSIYRAWGVAGVKVGFVNYGPMSATDRIRELAAAAARNRIWLDIHDEHVPDGFERTYPNVMISEGGGGAEGRHPVRQELVQPFTRCLAGPFDYTPVFFDSDRTHAHAAAMLLVYPGPTAVLRGNLEKAVKEDPAIFEFVKALPFVYDETVVPVGEIGRKIVVARRRGKTWYVAGLAGVCPETLSFGTDFMGTGRKHARLWTDGGYEERDFEACTELSVRTAMSGGFCAIVE